MEEPIDNKQNLKFEKKCEIKKRQKTPLTQPYWCCEPIDVRMHYL